MAAIQDREQAKEFVLRTVKERDVQFIRLWFTDVSGTLKGFAIMREELEEALNEGLGFDGSSIDGYARSDESDMIALPDPTTVSLLPWRPQERGVARLFCDILLPDGSPFTGDPRYVLKKNLEKAREKGFTFYVGPEMEYFYCIMTHQLLCVLVDINGMLQKEIQDICLKDAHIIRTKLLI